MWTADEVMDKITTLGRQFYSIAHDDETKPVARKYAVTSFSTLVDKWTIVSGRPTSIVQFADEPARQGVLELARRLALSVGETQSA